ncbi:Aste57867_24489 [Aphanomyces stellatus]|uniref:Tubulin--tyrosine ligase-like protein 5 n=1 Tax=Aphanomyces stellatus TaxID=120398 RepID=A0A485LQK5_9STRA|nr:hypothetical protein As57867_024412 [Aphanomyces stellatus]VFU01128.1 Aste57867_24489 [Aphanomyces stellatus]
MESRLGLRERLEQSRLQKLGEPTAALSPLHVRKTHLGGEPHDDVADAGLLLNQPDPVENDNDNDDDEERSIDDDGEEGDNGDDEEEEDDEIAPESQTPSMRVQHSRFPNRPPIVCFDYPADLDVTREVPDGVVVEEIEANAATAVYFKSYWERNCIKNAFFRAGLVRLKKGRKWTAAWVKHMPRTKFKLLQAHQRINHFPDPWVIGRKDRLMKTLVAMKRKFGVAYSFVPDGFLLPAQKDAFERLLDREAEPASLWIVKPPASACGRGIKVIQASQVDSLKKTKKLVVQRYLASPYLIHGFKFDLRIYVVVTSFDPLRIYLFNEGLARFCTVKYATSAAQLKNRLVHLTNFSVNKKNAAFKASTTDKDTDGSKWSWTALMDYLADQHVDVAVLRAKMKAIICKTIIAAEAHITPLTQTFVKHRNVCYELFGFDMMVDAALEPWLIEVNVSPSLMGSSPLDKRIKGLLMSDIFHLVGHPVPTQPLVKLPPTTTTTTTTGTPKRASTARKQLLDVLHDPKVPALEPAHLALFGDDDWDIVYSMEDEMDRLGHFERIYPAADADTYAPFFACARYANRLCEKWQKMKPKHQHHPSKVADKKTLLLKTDGGRRASHPMQQRSSMR